MKDLYEVLTFVGGGTSLFGAVIGYLIGQSLRMDCVNKCERILSESIHTYMACMRDCPDLWLFAVLGAVPGTAIAAVKFVLGK